MERPSVAGHEMWSRKLPPGFRFHPTDEELVLQYLKRKVYSCPLPAPIIPDIDISKFDPWDLPSCGGCGEARYLFSLKQARNLSRSRSNWPARSGVWRATGKEKSVMDPRGEQVVGTKKVLVFHQVKKQPTKTDWIMHEYCLASSNLPRRGDANHNCVVPDYWVLCRIVKKKRAAKVDAKGEEDDRMKELRDINFVESSCVTELPDACGEGEEEASSRRMSSTA